MRLAAFALVLGLGAAAWVLATDPASAQEAQPVPESEAAESAGDAGSPSDSKREWPGDPLVAQIQHGLRELGYEVSVVDGLMGPNTRKAIKAFQKDEGLTVTGEPSDALKRAIERRRFRRSEQAAALWRQARLYLHALGYQPGEGALDSEAARRALQRFAKDHWLELDQSFSTRMHEAIVGATRADKAAQTWLCRHYVTEKAYDDGFAWCRRAATKGVRAAQYYTGWMRYYGRGAERSYEAAFDWLRRAAKAGDSRAMTYVGLMYRLGRGVQRNPDAAIQWYKKAVETGKTDGGDGG